MNAIRVNLACGIGSVIVMACSFAVDPYLEEQARTDHSVSHLYLVAPGLHVLFVVGALSSLPLCIRQKDKASIAATCCVLLIAWVAIRAGVSGYRRYSITMIRSSDNPDVFMPTMVNEASGTN